jgi:hypothetical protein
VRGLYDVPATCCVRLALRAHTHSRGTRAGHACAEQRRRAGKAGQHPAPGMTGCVCKVESANPGQT